MNNVIGSKGVVRNNIILVVSFHRGSNYSGMHINKKCCNPSGTEGVINNQKQEDEEECKEKLEVFLGLRYFNTSLMFSRF